MQGRWLSPDPAGTAAVDPTTPQSLNRYVYVLNNPLALIDPFGLWCVWSDGTPPDDVINEAACIAAGGYWDPSNSATACDADTGQCTGPGGQYQICNGSMVCFMPDGAVTGTVFTQACAFCNFSLTSDDFYGLGGYVGTGGGGANGGQPQNPTATHCVGQALAAKGVSIVLDLAGSIPGFGNLFSGAVEGIQGLNAAYYGGLSIMNAGNTLMNPSASGAGFTATSAALTVGSLAFNGSKVIPVIGTAVSVISLGYDSIKAVQAYHQCMAGGG